ncbi:hypothetical protein ACIQB5_48445 [Streptomyces sp. NPDC088560]|uniref:hypothetical protein n=1 Tax=Streptomyces sp. NPDC088560 TaxID=3365868 RepID=UPI00380E035A
MNNSAADKDHSVFREKLYYLADITAVPTVTNQAPDGLDTRVGKLLGFAAWAGTAAGIAGVIITGAMMTISLKRGETSEHMSRLGMVLCGCILIATAGPIVSFAFH